MNERRIILFGGTFDPVHLGHTQVTSFAAKEIGAERIIFVPAKRSPLKGYHPIAEDDRRLKMISLAIEGLKNFEVSDWELTKPAPSFTLNTVGHFKKIFGEDSSIYLLVGADTVKDLMQWYNITELLDACNLSVMYRGGFDKPDFDGFIEVWGKDRIEKLCRNTIQTPLIDISSTEIRKRIKENQSIDDLVAPRVAEYIREHDLYSR